MPHAHALLSKCRSARGNPGARAVALAGVLLVAASAGVLAQSATPKMPDPRLAVVVLEDFGAVGLRISDAQGLAEATLHTLRSRISREAVVFQGAKDSAALMKKLMGKPIEGTPMQDAQLSYFEAAAAIAPWRVRIRFGMSGKTHFIDASCRKKDVDPADTARLSDRQRFEGGSFQVAREAFDAALPRFCLALPTKLDFPVEGGPKPAGAGAPGTQTDAGPAEPLGLRKKKDASTWTPPPRRD